MDYTTICQKKAGPSRTGAEPSSMAVPTDVAGRYDVADIRHALTILQADLPEQWRDLLAALRGPSQDLLPALDQAGWAMLTIDFERTVNGIPSGLERHLIELARESVGLITYGGDDDLELGRDVDDIRAAFTSDVIDVAVLIDYSQSDLVDYVRENCGGCPVLVLTPSIEAILGDEQG